MTDLEMIKKCAEKMGYNMQPDDVPHDLVMDYYGYNPLINDAQCFELIKNICGQVHTLIDSGKSAWHVRIDGVVSFNENLNRAIVECVSRLPD